METPSPPCTPRSLEKLFHNHFNGRFPPELELDSDSESDFECEIDDSERDSETEEQDEEAVMEESEPEESEPQYEPRNLTLNYHQGTLDIKYRPCEFIDEAMSDAAAVFHAFYQAHPHAPQIHSIAVEFCIAPESQSVLEYSDIVQKFYRPGLQNLMISFHAHLDLEDNGNSQRMSDGTYLEQFIGDDFSMAGVQVIVCDFYGNEPNDYRTGRH